MVSRRQKILCRIATACLLLMGLATQAAPRSVRAAEKTETWQLGGTPTGFAGIHRLLYGHAAAPSGLTFAVGADVAHAQDLLFVGAEDRFWISRQHLAVVWTLGSVLELGIGATSSVAADSVFPGSVATNALPAFRLKWNAGSWQHWAGGLAASWQAPPLSGSSGALAPADATYTLQALGSRAIAQAWEFSLNIGFIYDRAGSAGSSVTNPVQLFVDNRNTTSRISLGMGVASLLHPRWRHLALGPYAEITSEWAIRGGHLADNPVQLNVGSKVFFGSSHAIEADVGVDVRIFGAPRYGSFYAGLPPWSIFAALSYHSRLAALDIGDRQVVYVPTPVHKPTVVLSGYVHDSNALVLANARLTIGGDANTLLSVDPNTGHFQTMAFLVTRGASRPQADVPGTPSSAGADASGQALEITCEAPGYITQRRTIQPPAEGGMVPLDFHLQRQPASARLHLRIFNIKTGAAPEGAKVFVTGDDDNDAPLTAVKGEVRASIRPGHYTLIITAPGYLQHRSQVDLTDEAELILHIGLRHKPRATPKLR